jgi:hypothetical protein
LQGGLPNQGIFLGIPGQAPIVAGFTASIDDFDTGLLDQFVQIPLQGTAAGGGGALAVGVTEDVEQVGDIQALPRHGGGPWQDGLQTAQALDTGLVGGAHGGTVPQPLDIYWVWRVTSNHWSSFSGLSNCSNRARTMTVAGLLSANFWRISPNMAAGLSGSAKDCLILQYVDGTLKGLAANTKDQLAKAYPRSKNDLLAIMVERGLELLRPGGRIGAITSRTCFFLSRFQKWREQIVLGMAKPEVMADLGHGVMDDAMVEAAPYCLVKQ